MIIGRCNTYIENEIFPKKENIVLANIVWAVQDDNIINRVKIAAITCKIREISVLAMPFKWAVSYKTSGVHWFSQAIYNAIIVVGMSNFLFRRILFLTIIAPIINKDR